MKSFTLLKRCTALVMGLLITSAGVVKAEEKVDTVKIGSFYYVLDDATKTAKMTRNAEYKEMAKIEIPAKVNNGTADYSVTTITQQCFQQCTMSEIVFPNTLTTIEKWAFYGCNNLKSVNFPASLKYLGLTSFQNCKILAEATFNGPVEELCESIFTGCYELAKVVLSDEQTYLPKAMFNNCESLATVNFPSKLDSLANNVFYGNGLTEVVLPPSLRIMGNAVFSRNSKLTKVTIPGSLKNMGSQSFYECGALEEVVLGEGIEYLGENTFYNNKKLSKITLPSTVKSLTPFLFYGCASLESLVLPASVTQIPPSCFYQSGLKSFPTGGKITEVGANAFQGCSGLVNVELPSTIKILNKYSFYQCRNLESINLPSGIEQIWESCFHTCTSLKQISIPASCATLGDNPFTACQGLTAINVDANNPNYASVDGVLTDKAKKLVISYPGAKASWVMPESIEEVGGFAFNNLPAVTDITFSKNIKKIGQSAFYGSSIKEAIFGDKLESIGMTAFFMVRSLTKIVLGNNDFTTGNNCFSATAVPQLVFPESVTTIGINDGAGTSIIGSDANLTAVWLPSTLKEFSPFGSGCAKLAKIYCWAKTAPKLNGKNKINLPEGCVIYVPKGTAEAYNAAWTEANLYQNMTFKDVLPGDPELSESEGVGTISWEPFTEEGYIGEVAKYSLTLYKGIGETRTEISTRELDPKGQPVGSKAEGDTPAKINVSLGSLEKGDYSVVLKGYTALGELVMNYDGNLSVGTSGIEDINVDGNVPAEYYNLQGVRVTNPEKGNVYIMLKDNKATKVVY